MTLRDRHMSLQRQRYDTERQTHVSHMTLQRQRHYSAETACCLRHLSLQCVAVCCSVLQCVALSQTLVHSKSSLYLPLGSVNLVLKLMGTPEGISTRSG